MLKEKKFQLAVEICFYLIVLASVLIFVFSQPFGYPPDEVNRYLVAKYISVYATLPKGDELQVAIYGYGGSYAYQPILPYILQGFVMRAVSLFAGGQLALLICARLVNACFGLIMAVYIRKLAKLLFPDLLSGWLFSVLVMFLPQNLFLHSYVNTDSMAIMSGSIMLYACVAGWKHNWPLRHCLTLSIGIICCLLSYYNAYGLIVASALIFFFSYCSLLPAGHLTQKNRVSINVKPLLKKGLFISLIVLVTAGWWFLRNYFIYDGDMLGLAARTQNAMETSLPEFSPLNRITPFRSGLSLGEMFSQTDFFPTLWNSFVARFGTMDLPTFPCLYPWYYTIFILGFLFCLIPGRLFHKEEPSHRLSRIFFHVSMFIAVLIPFALCIFYSYYSDYQPQGRYIMPALIPFMYFIARGFEKITFLLETKCNTKLPRLIPVAVILFFTISLLFTMFGIVIPYYRIHENLWNTTWFMDAVMNLYPSSP